MRTSDPATRPPPNTRSNSEMPVRVRSSTAAVISVKGVGPQQESPERDGSLRVTASSTRVFQPAQSGHFPSHLADWYPQL